MRARLPQIVERVRKGAQFTVLYRSRPAFRIVPMHEAAAAESDLGSDTLYRAKPLGRSSDRRSAVEHDSFLYSR